LSRKVSPEIMAITDGTANLEFKYKTDLNILNIQTGKSPKEHRRKRNSENFALKASEFVSGLK
jgi:hypothetical protein